MKDYSAKALLEFLEMAGKKGLIAKGTAVARKSASNKILSVIDDHEASDIRNLNKEQTFTKFVNLNAKKFKPASLKIYKARFNKAIDDFIRWVNDPINFNSNTIKASKTNKVKNKEPSIREGINNNNCSEQAQTNILDDRTYSFPIPLKENLIVQINNLPINLTVSEAKKIGGVLLALAIRE